MRDVSYKSLVKVFLTGRIEQELSSKAGHNRTLQRIDRKAAPADLIVILREKGGYIIREPMHHLKILSALFVVAILCCTPTGYIVYS
jgi:hypothetical protein